MNIALVKQNDGESTHEQKFKVKHCSSYLHRTWRHGGRNHADRYQTNRRDVRCEQLFLESLPGGKCSQMGSYFSTTVLKQCSCPCVH